MELEYYYIIHLAYISFTMYAHTNLMYRLTRQASMSYGGFVRIGNAII